MKKKNCFYLAFVLVFSVAAECNKKGGGSGSPEPPPAVNEIDMWLTRADQTVLLQKQNKVIGFTSQKNSFPDIIIDEGTTFQTVDGFGYTLTGASAMLIDQMPESAKGALLTELFGPGPANMGISYLRLSIGASDLDPAVFSYNDLPAGQTDEPQQHFNLDPDRTHLIPVLKKILAINPSIKFLSSPWSSPVWMKDNKSSKGGSLLPEYYDSYATYFVKYIQEMKKEGISITAITPQNEPLHPGNNPSMYMTAEQQRDFIKQSLGPAFESAGLSTKIVVYDHNLDRPDYPAVIYQDPEAAKYVDGAAFHLYAGNVEAMGNLHNAYPGKNLYFTEQWTGAKGTFDGDLQWHIKNVIIGTMRNWSKIALEWNLASDPSYGPHTPGGCTECKGALTISGSAVSRNVSYYIIAHASAFVPPGSVRIASNQTGAISNVVFQRPDGKKVMIALNEGSGPFSFNLKYKGKWATVQLDGKSVATIVW